MKPKIFMNLISSTISLIISVPIRQNPFKSSPRNLMRSNLQRDPYLKT